MNTETIHEYYLYEWNINKRDVRDSRKIEKTNEKVDAEELIADYYRMEFTVFNVEPSSIDTLDRLPEQVSSKVMEHPSVVGEIPAGFPDLILYDEEEDEIAYCEVKMNSDGLRFKQLKFIQRASRPVSVAFVQEEKYEEVIQFRCTTCGATFDEEKNLEDHSCSIDGSIKGIMNWEGYGFGKE